MSGELSVRAAAQGDRAARALARLAEDVEVAGLPAQARLLRDASGDLGALAFRAARAAGVTAAHIVQFARPIATSCEACVADLGASGLDGLAERAKAVQIVVEGLSRDAAAASG